MTPENAVALSPREWVKAMSSELTREDVIALPPYEWFKAVFNGLPSEYVWAMFFVLAVEGARVNGPRGQHRYGTAPKRKGGRRGTSLRIRCKRK